MPGEPVFIIVDVLVLLFLMHVSFLGIRCSLPAPWYSLIKMGELLGEPGCFYEKGLLRRAGL